MRSKLGLTIVAWHGLALLAFAAPDVAPPHLRASATPDVPPLDSRLVYEGRWSLQGSTALADWPNTAIYFQVRGSGTVRALLDGGSVVGGTKVGVTCTPLDGGVASYTEFRVGTRLVGYSTPTIAELPQNSSSTYLVSLTKLTEASFFPELPLGVEESTIAFAGLQLSGSVSVLAAPARPGRRVEVVGDSDTTAWGTEDFLNTSSTTCVKNWVANQNCGKSWAADLAHRLGSQLQVVATMGKGVYMNADTLKFPSGPPMPGVYDRALASKSSPSWNFSRWSPDLVLIRLGANDYSRKEPPAVPVFIKAYHDFIRTVFRVYRGSARNVTVVNVCGGSYPSDGGRNSVCPTVRAVSESWSRLYAKEGRVEYVEIPPGIAADADRGCLDHPRVAAHAKIAKYIEPTIRRIMAWSDESFASSLYV